MCGYHKRYLVCRHFSGFDALIRSFPVFSPLVFPRVFCFVFRFCFSYPRFAGIRSLYFPFVPHFCAISSARALAKKKGVDLSNITGTGNYGRVTEADVMSSLGQTPKGKGGAPSTSADSGMAAREAPDLPDGPKVGENSRLAHTYLKTLTWRDRFVECFSCPFHVCSSMVECPRSRCPRCTGSIIICLIFISSE